MATLTYLELINKVLRKLRQDQVTSVSGTAYTSLIGEFVNDAKREVEDAWDWQALRGAATFTSTPGTAIYNLPTINERSRLLEDECGRPMAFDITTGSTLQLQTVDVDYKDGVRNLNPVTNAQPLHFSLTCDGSTYTVEFLDTPEQARDYKFYFCIPSDPLETSIDELRVPWAPVVNLATLYALDERGEEIGEPGSKAWIRYNNSLADAIAFDAKNSTRKLIWQVV